MPPYRIALACLTPMPDTDELGDARLPSYGIRRVQAAVVADPVCPGHTVEMFDFGRADVASYVQSILAFRPDILGFSIYVWSTECMVAVAREIKRLRPRCLIVFGGPSARSALFDLDYYGDPGTYLDALVEGDGEAIFRDIARLPKPDRAMLLGVRGVTIPSGRGGWHRTPLPLNPDALDQLPSPFQLGLMPTGTVAYLETYRGCPMSCRFCEWGTDRGRGVFSADYIAREIEAFERAKTPAVFLLDAGLNLNIRAFRNLRQAANETGFLKNTLFWAEIYPSIIRDEHLDFLREIGPAYLGVGLQSRDPEVLKLHQRPSDDAKFDQAVRKLAAVTNIELQVIFGLPGDTPDGFRRTLDYALSLPAAVRAYHCLVLPDALMTRGLPEWNMVFDPRNLAMMSCLGWNPDDIQSMRQELGSRSRQLGGKSGNFWWSFPAQIPATALAIPA